MKSFDIDFFVNNPITIIYIKPDDKEFKRYKFTNNNIKKKGSGENNSLSYINNETCYIN